MIKDGIKIVTIGGGSSYTPELMEGFIKRYHELPIKEIWLVDIEDGKEKLEIVGELAKRMWQAAGYPVEVHLTLNRREALKDADFVTTQFRVGLLPARIKDERIPLYYGMLGQETNGASGIFKAFRTIPVIKAIVDDMRELCPDAWLINFTNPSGMITETVIKHFGWKRCIGLCNVPEIAMKHEPKNIGKTREELNYRFAGLNHFHWHKVFDKDGNNVTAQIINHLNDADGGTPKNIFQAKFPLDLIQATKLLPCGYHRYYYLETEMVSHAVEEFQRHGTRAEQVKATEDALFELYKNPNLNVKPKELEKRGGTYYSDAACECISAIYNDKRQILVVNTQNNGAISCLPYDSIVEISSLVSAAGAEPLTWGNFDAHERGWLQLMKAMEECVIDAALTGDYGMALKAFNINPLIENGENGINALNELFVAHEKYLPQFADTIKILKDKGIFPKDEVVRELLTKS